jgi:hypothetical protein
MKTKPRPYTSLIGRKRIETVIGYVCGIIYQGSEWLDNGRGLCSAFSGPAKDRNAKIHKTEAAAQKRLAKMGWDEAKWEKFVRPYIHVSWE